MFFDSMQPRLSFHRKFREPLLLAARTLLLLFLLLALARLAVPKMGNVLGLGGEQAVVIVIDNSSSMGGEKLGAIQESLSYVVRHALRPCDRLGLISYDDEAQAICEPMAMDAMGRRLALMSINAMHALGKTNMSGGLLEGCKMIRDSAAMSRPPSPPTTATTGRCQS